MNTSHESTKPQRDKEEVASTIVDCTFHLHRDLGPGLLETVYEGVLVELKSVENLAAVHGKQVLTYLRLPAHCEWPAILCVFASSCEPEIMSLIRHRLRIALDKLRTLDLVLTTESHTWTRPRSPRPRSLLRPGHYGHGPNCG